MEALTDIGVNLTHRSFGADLAEVLHRARSAGVGPMVVTGLSEDVSLRAAKLAEAHGLYSTAGVHPHNAKSFGGRTVETLRALSARERVVAIGECGLDFNRDFSPRDVQRRCFEAQLELAAEVRLPVFLHERDAFAEFTRILERHRASLVGGVVHCFTGNREAMTTYLELGLHIGITGWICDERRGAHLLEQVRHIPKERLLIETDAPFLRPRSIRPRPDGRRNEPAFLPYVLETVARARGEAESVVAAQTTRNARRLFGIEPRPKER